MAVAGSRAGKASVSTGILGAPDTYFSGELYPKPKTLTSKRSCAQGLWDSGPSGVWGMMWNGELTVQQCASPCCSLEFEGSGA